MNYTALHQAVQSAAGLGMTKCNHFSRSFLCS
jgi:hypothetical protein